MEDVPGLGVPVPAGPLPSRPVTAAAAPAAGAQPLGDGGAERVDLAGEYVAEAPPGPVSGLSRAASQRR